MTDKHQRTIDYLRISVTDRCNLRCRYCMPEDAQPFEEDRLLKSPDLIRIVKAAAALGISHIRLTGGEPLLRRDIVSLTEQCKRIPGVETVTLTTNGVLLERMLPALLAAGLDGVNISLDTMDRERYKKLTGRDELAAVLHSLNEAIRTGIRVKINCVPFPGFSELSEFTELVKNNPIDVRFIEMMPIGEGKKFAAAEGERCVTDGLLAELKQEYPDLHADPIRHGNGPAVYYRSERFRGSIGLIDAMNHNFCESCNRVRLTADGFLKLCLCFNRGVDLKQYAACHTDGELLDYMAEAILKKPVRHEFDAVLKENGDEPGFEDRRMSQIGG